MALLNCLDSEDLVKKAQISYPAYCRVTGEWIELDLSGLGEWGIEDSLQNQSMTSLIVMAKRNPYVGEYGDNKPDDKSDWAWALCSNIDREDGVF